MTEAAADAAWIAALPSLAFAFVLVLSRVGTAVMLLPGVGEMELPGMVRAGFALALTMLLLPAIAPAVPALPSGMAGAGMIGADLLVGLTLGMLARLPVLALSMTGAVLSYMTGLTSVVQPDPALGGQSAALSRMFGLVASTLVLSTGLYAWPLEALAGSYGVIPPGSVVPVGAVADLVQNAVGASFGLAVRLSGPFILVGLLYQAGLGLLARLVPQLQVFSAAAPGQILGGLAILGSIAAALLAGWSDAVRSSFLTLPGL